MKFKKTITALALATLISAATAVPAFAGITNAKLGVDQWGSSSNVKCEEAKHNSYVNGHTTMVTKTNSGGRTWGLARSNNNSDSQVMVAVKMGGERQNTAYGVRQVTSATYSKWGKVTVEAQHSRL